MNAPIKHNFFYMLAGLLGLFLSVPMMQNFQRKFARIFMCSTLAVTLSICTYLIAGFIWTYLYIIQNLMVPGSFRGMSAGEASH